ncbi:hypothetical protein C8Q75DRAFT_802118 [Abortiporus biennis]|nr:hypothetical protein C8Q75DRAFT_802118 [Abortiporus biennis]
MKPITDAYLEWKGAAETTNSSSVTQDQPIGEEALKQTYPYVVKIYDIFSLEEELTIQRPAESLSPAIDLMRIGYLAKSPREPRLPYKHNFRAIIADIYEIYLTVLQEVDRRVLEALRWNTPDWQVQNACQACCYKLEDKPQLTFSHLWAFDGNNSLKRMSVSALGNRTAGDTRTFEDADYFLPQAYVDRFANEVCARDEVEAIEVKENSEGKGNPTDGCTENVDLDQCTRNWKAAATEEKKKMWPIFDEMGIFADSGYGEEWRIGIHSPFLPNSSISLTPALVEAMTLDVPFHRRYMHNYICQLTHHPNIIKGIGLEDLETMEQIFSSSNQLASVVWYASPYQRHLFIHVFFQQWDWEKYANSANFLYNNLRQAFKIIKEDLVTLEQIMASLNITDADIDAWEKEEISFFSIWKNLPLQF